MFLNGRLFVSLVVGSLSSSRVIFTSDASAAPYHERLHAAPEGTAAHDERSAQQARLPDRLVVQRQRKSFRELRHHRLAWSAGAAVQRR